MDGAPSGQWQARRELQAIEKLTNGGVRIGEIREPVDEKFELVIVLVINCVERQDTAAIGVELQDVESVLVRIPSDYPLRMPMAVITHDRFATLPHVVWNSWICLYLSEDDWDPSHGMFGFVERLLTWFQHVAEGTASGPDQPWDPPITRASWYDGMLVVAPDVPDTLEDDPALWSATAVLEQVGPGRFALRSWVDGDIRNAAAGEDGLLAPVVGLPEPVAFSYPRHLGELMGGVRGQQGGAAFHVLAKAVATPYDVPDGVDPDRVLPLVLVVSPAPRYVKGGSRCAHIAAWWVDTLESTEFSPSTPLSWMTVYDQRPRTTVRRDSTRPTDWLAGKRVLLLGCGGLGAPTAEFCARAGTARLDLVDRAVVRPGVLVRQPFTLDDIDRPKVDVLRLRLEAVGEDVVVCGQRVDAIDLLTDQAHSLDVDLIIDATASAGVAAALERMRWTRDGPNLPVLSLTVGHRCDLATATLSLPTATGGGSDVLRRLAVTALQNDSLHDVLDDLLPDPPRTEMFQPEPGCSDPTYVGSAADLASFAGQLLNQALIVLRAPVHPAAPASWAAVVRSPGDDGAGAPAQRLHWPADRIVHDPDHGYEVRLDIATVAAIRGEIARSAVAGSPHVETGGLLLGQIDHAARVVWVNEADGPPPGSDHRVGSLGLHLDGAQDMIEQRLIESRQLIGLVGLWHTHPDGPTSESAIDQLAMDDIVARRHTPTLLVIVSGTGGAAVNEPESRPTWWARLHFP